MPWKVNKIMDQRIKFAQEAQNTSNFRELCSTYGISRPTGYKWLSRYREHGAQGMLEQSKRPKRSPNELDENTVCELIKLAAAHPTWGPRKIQELYKRKHGKEGLPSESSVKRVLKKAGMTKPKRKRKAQPSHRINTGVQATAPNHVWTVDFKGWWKGKDGMKVEPLSVRDEYSRKVMDVRLLESNGNDAVIEAFKVLFNKYGLPDYIRSDNGTPFAASNSLLGLSRFSVWLLALGIKLERNRPGCPQDNGAHERMHLDIHIDLERQGTGRDQTAFDIWKDTFNAKRPHESLGMRFPDEVYQPSSKKYTGTPDELDYGNMQSRKV
ncbi:MAG: helix-turn-helix domain-containing protein, partial [Myxococcota bacterium]